MQLEVFKGLGGVCIECNQRECARLIKSPPAHGNNTHRRKTVFNADLTWHGGGFTSGQREREIYVKYFY